ncbi:MAG: hypothetical protein ACOYK9_03705 [Chlamydiia bacterium]
MSSKPKNLSTVQPLNKVKSVANITKNFNEKTVCYVLITCEKPQGSGSMHVDLVFEGDKSLAAHLINTAQGVLDT